MMDAREQCIADGEEFRVSRTDSVEAEADYDEALAHIDAIIKLTKRYFKSGWTNEEWHELGNACRLIETTSKAAFDGLNN